MKEKLKVAIQGYEGSFHHIVANRCLGRDITISPCATFREVARQVESKEADYGVMAVENSIAGTILPNLGILYGGKVQIVGEYYLRICQNLLVLPDVELSDIEEVQSHPMALLQCVDYLDQNRWRLVETEDTALSARHIAQQGLRHSAAIASDLAAELFGLKVIAPNIHSIPNNFTRFVLLRPQGEPISPEANKASLCFKTNHTHGSLVRVLNQMQDSSINMTKLQSSPIPSEPWHYMFHVDMEFDRVWDYEKAIANMSNVSEELYVYGVYERAKNVQQQ